MRGNHGMKFEIEPQDVEVIAQRVSDILRPMIARVERADEALPWSHRNKRLYGAKGL